MQPVPMPAPFKGIDEELPIIAVQSPYCESLINFNLMEQGAEVRNGDSIFSFMGGAPRVYGAGFTLYLHKYGDQYLFVSAYNTNTGQVEFWDVEAGTLAYSPAVAASASFRSFYFNGYLFFLTPTAAHAPGYYFNGAAWGAIGYTGISAAGAGAEFHHRAYITKIGSAIYFYSDLYAITGAVHSVDLSTIIDSPASIVNLARITLSDNVSTQDLLAFVFSSGEVLFYSGNYPDSSDWTLAGHADISRPLYYNTGFQYQGDFIILTETGMISLRDLFLNGSGQAESLALSSKAEKTWREIAVDEGVTAVGFKGVWDSVNQRIVIFTPINGAATEFIYDTSLKAWYFHQPAPGLSDNLGQRDAIFYKGKIYWASRRSGQANLIVWEKEGASGFQDRNYDDASDVNYIYDMISAPVSGGRAQVQVAGGMDVILETDLETVTDYYLIGDFGVLTQGPQKLPDLPSGVQKPNVNIGLESSFIQYRITGTTTSGKSVGLKMYGTNLWIEQGQAPR